MGNTGSKTLYDGIESAELDDQGNLTFKKSNKTALGPFKVKGEPGVGIASANVNEDGVLNLSLTDGKMFDFKVKGQDGKDGVDGKNGKDGKDGSMSGGNGRDGSTGPAGPAGRPGIKGDTGSQGIQGIQGLNGLKGDTGSQGIQGIPGVSISSANVNEDGVLNLSLTDGKMFDFKVKGQDGKNGKDGKDGSTGPAGPAGPAGIKGDTGSQGIQGPVGAQGPTATLAGFDLNKFNRATAAISKDDDGWTRVNGVIAAYSGLSTDSGINIGSYDQASHGLNIKNGDGNFTHFNFQNSSTNYIRGTTIINGKLNVDTICASDGNHCVNIWDIVNKNGRYTVENEDGRRLQMSGGVARATDQNSWGAWEKMRFYN